MKLEDAYPYMLHHIRQMHKTRSYREIENIVGIPHATIQRWLTDQTRKPSIEKVVQFFESVGLHVEIYITEKPKQTELLRHVRDPETGGFNLELTPEAEAPNRIKPRKTEDGISESSPHSASTCEP